MKFTNEEERTTALCAYVLGEAGPEERAAIEAELAGSAELRAQKAELEATIGLVQTALGGDETLSPGAHDEVLRAAQARRPRWQVLRTPWLAAAAGICAVAFGWYVFESGPRTPVAPETQLARLDDAKAEAGRGMERAKDGAPDEKDALVLRDELAAGAELERRAGEPLPSAAAEGDPAGHELRFDSANAPAPAGSAGIAKAREGDAEALDELVVDAGTLIQQELARQQSDSVHLGIEKKGELAGADVTLVRPTTGTVHPRVIRVEERALEEPVQREGAASGPVTGGGATGKFGNRGLGGSSRASGSAAPGSAPASARYGNYRPPHSEVKKALADVGYVGEEDPSLQVDERLEALKGLGYGGGEPDFLNDSPFDEGLFDSALGNDDFFIGRGAARQRAHLTPEQREKAIEAECIRIIERCRRRPNEQPSAMYFRYWGDNPFELTALDAQSTFGVDVDTASYALVRNYLRQGTIPPREAVRTEEFVNWFAPDVPAPTEGTFAIHSELAPSRFGGDASRWMLEVAVRGREVAREERKPLSLTFVVDTSGSMNTGNRIEMVKHALRLLLAELDGNDTVAIVAFSNEARLVLPATPASQRGLIESAIHPLAPNGGTNAEAGLVMGYEAALAGLRANASNRVVFLSDGVANVGQTDQDRITEEVARHRKQGVYLNTIGVGMSNHNDVLLEQLANKGDGICNYIDSPAEARRALVENFTGQFEPIARDVKVQVEFDPRQVLRWRLLGYENRAIADKDFRNDAVDAGELGSGHQVVALYEIERTMAAADAPIATVRLRWKPPYVAGMGQAALEAGEEASEVEQPVFARGTSWAGASDGYKRAVLVAQFAEILRRSSHARGDSLDALLRDIELLARDGDDDVRELFDLVRQSRELVLRSLPACDELCLTIDEVRRWNLRQAELELLRVERDQKELEDLARRNAELEQRIRDLVRRKYEDGPR